MQPECELIEDASLLSSVKHAKPKKISVSRTDRFRSHVFRYFFKKHQSISVSRTDADPLTTQKNYVSRLNLLLLVLCFALFMMLSFFMGRITSAPTASPVSTTIDADDKKPFQKNPEFYEVPILHQLDRETGYFAIVKNSTTKIMMNIGIKNTFDGMLEVLDTNENAILIAFEPDHDSWHPHFQTSQFQSYPDRVIFLPVAIANVIEPELRTFYHYRSPWCNSLLKMSESSTICAGNKVLTKNKVPVIPLRHMLKLVPFVSELKIDAQGADFDIILSGEEMFHEKVETVLVEAQDLPRGDIHMIYNGSVPLNDFREKFKQLGYKNIYCRPNQSGKKQIESQEMNCRFDRIKEFKKKRF